MPNTKVETIFWIIGVVLFASAAIVPRSLLRLLGGGRVAPSGGFLMFLRVVAVVCVLGTVYRLVFLWTR